MQIAVWESPGEGPPLVFSHATGFHGRCWDQIVNKFPGRRSLAIEFRGHGRSSKPDPPIPWRAFGEDLTAMAEQLDVQGAIGVGHSMGGHALVSAISMRPKTFAALLLLDPVILPPARYSRALFDAAFILRRRAQWTSWEEMFERFRSRPPFQSWQPEILRDYCEYALLPHNGGYTLACPPSIEASIYEGSAMPQSNLYSAIPEIRQPVTIVRAGYEIPEGVLDLNASPTAADLASKFPHGRDLFLAGANHYFPMEQPNLVVEQIGRITAELAV